MHCHKCTDGYVVFELGEVTNIACGLRVGLVEARKLAGELFCRGLDVSHLIGPIVEPDAHVSDHVSSLVWFIVGKIVMECKGNKKPAEAGLYSIIHAYR